MSPISAITAPPARQLISTEEWTTVLVEGARLDPADRELVDSLRGEFGRLDIEEMLSGVRITSKSWVGVVRLSSLDIQVVPKLAGEHLGLTELIEYTRGLEALKRNRGRRELEFIGENLLDVLIRLLVEAAEDVVRSGLLSDYVEREEELALVRGRILADRQVLKRFGLVDRVICRHDEHEQDIFENRLLGFAMRLAAERATHERTRRDARRLRLIFEEICDPDQLDLSALDAVVYSRMNEHYRESHELARLLIDGLGIEDVLAPRGRDSFSFLLDMNRLFEQFMHKVLERIVALPDVVHYQRSDPSIVRDSHGRPYSRIIPDLLVQQDDRRIPVDAKYKRYDDWKVAVSDISQTFLYSYAYAGRTDDAGVAAIVYPSTTHSIRSEKLSIWGHGWGKGSTIHIVSVPIPELLHEIHSHGTGGLLAELAQAIGLTQAAEV